MSSTATFTELDASEQKRLLDKLAKLKALSQCPTGNVNETATAAAAMTRIMLEYQIEMADLDAGSEVEEQEVLDQPVFPEDSFNGFPSWKTHILSALAKVNHCLSYSSSSSDYSLFSRRTRSRLSLIGAAADIENTSRLFFFCVDEIDRLCKSWGRGESVKRKNDFKRGAAKGIADKVMLEHDRVLQETAAKARARGQASNALELFGRKEQAVANFAADLGIYSEARRSRGVQADAYHAGYNAGANLDLSRGARPGLPAASKE